MPNSPHFSENRYTYDSQFAGLAYVLNFDSEINNSNIRLNEKNIKSGRDEQEVIKQMKSKSDNNTINSLKHTSDDTSGRIAFLENNSKLE